MNLHLFTIIIVYTLFILITHIILKNNIRIPVKHNFKKKQILKKNKPVKNQVNIGSNDLDNLENIQDFDETSIRDELMSYLNQEKKQRDEELTNYLVKTGETSIKGNNFYTKKSVANFDNEELKIDKHFNTINNDTYSFNPVPTNKNDDIHNNILNSGILTNSDNKVFGDIEAFDDFDQSYANIL